MDARTIKSKIDALSRMTVANGCTPAEAKNAAAMASRLRAKLPPDTHSDERSKWWSGPEEWDRINRENEQVRQWYHRQQAESAMWRIFAQGLRGFGDPTYPTHDVEREQSVLDDLDAFLGTRRNGKLRF